MPLPLVSLSSYHNDIAILTRALLDEYSYTSTKYRLLPVV
jgi:hypothetical protein